MKKIILLLFILLPLAIGAVVFITPDRAVSENENRNLKTKNSISFKVFDGSFQKDLEDYLSDQFPLKDALKAAQSKAEYTLGRRNIGGAYVGKDYRLFQAVTETDFERETLIRNADKISRIAADTGVDTFVMLIPSAETALGALLPDGAPVYDYDALYNELCRHYPGASVIDVKDTLSSDESNYYRTDHHWTTGGAYLAYCEWCKAHGNTAEDYSALNPAEVCRGFRGSLYSKVLFALPEYDSVTLIEKPDGLTVEADGQKIELYDLQSAQTKDKYNVFEGGNHGILTVTNNAVEGKTLVIVKDSFANSFLPFLVRDYHKIIMIDERYTLVDIRQIIEENDADELAVIKEIVS
jgi:hypothetical protein